MEEITFLKFVVTTQNIVLVTQWAKNSNYSYNLGKDSLLGLGNFGRFTWQDHIVTVTDFMVLHELRKQWKWMNLGIKLGILRPIAKTERLYLLTYFIF